MCSAVRPDSTTGTGPSGLLDWEPYLNECRRILAVLTEQGTRPDAMPWTLRQVNREVWAAYGRKGADTVTVGNRSCKGVPLTPLHVGPPRRFPGR